MRRTFLGLLALATCSTVSAQVAESDSLRTVTLQDVQVVSLRATSKTPMAFTNVSRDDINKQNHGQDVPFLISSTPSVITTTDAGAGIGYTGFRIRGVDPSRINITANGVPLNDSESSLVYFSNMGDFASSLQSMQIQRGVGTSTNGAGAFGATVNMLTENINAKPYVNFSTSVGSYGSHKETLRFSTGLINHHFGVQGRLSNIGSDGYIDRATSRLNSYFLQAGYFDDNTSVKFITFNGTERTYMAWNYTSKYEQSLYGRRYNSCGLYYDEEGKMRFYEDQYDNYHQQHYQLHWNQLMGTDWKLNVALHYTRDDYDYDQMKSNKKLYQWLLTDDKSMRANLVQRKEGVKDFYGAIASLNFDNHEGLTANVGGGWNHYQSERTGRVMWVGSPYYKGAESTALPLANLKPGFSYYNNDSKKTDLNFYGKVNWEFTKGLSAFADLQYRHINFQMDGPIGDMDSNDKMINIKLNNNFDFFNPKFGLNYDITPNHRVYASYAIAHREPTRDHYEEHYGEEIKAERMGDVEVGYQFHSPRFTAGINLYHMHYKNQFVLTGELDDEGVAITKNIDKSYRMGVELEAAWMPIDWFRWDANATFSKNRAKDMIVTLDDYSTLVNVGETPLSFSPGFIFNNIFNFNYKGMSAMIQSQYVGDQYLTNYGVKEMTCWSDWAMDDAHKTSETLMLKKHFTTNIDLSYQFNFPHCTLKSAKVGVTFYNIFSAKFDNNGWAAPQFRQDSNGNVYAVNTWGLRDSEAVGFAPSAPFHFMAHLDINF
jgi:iron complex outermembrane receptor protein